MKQQEFDRLAAEIRRSTALPYTFDGGVFEAFRLGIHTALAVLQRHLEKVEPATPPAPPVEEPPKEPAPAVEESPSHAEAKTKKGGKEK